MSVCHVCFMERSAAGVCDCDAPTAQVKTTPAVITPAPVVAPIDSNAPMSNTEVMRVARELLDAHNLDYVTLEWMNTTTRLGEMRYNRYRGPSRIRFSRKMFPYMTRAEQMNTITHEVAHALTWGLGHNHVWRRKHIELGGTGERCSAIDETVNEKVANWVGTCPNGHKAFRQRETAKMHQVSCAKCSRSFNPAYMFVWKRS